VTLPALLRELMVKISQITIRDAVVAGNFAGALERAAGKDPVAGGSTMAHLPDLYGGRTGVPFAFLTDSTIWSSLSERGSVVVE
jgi:hypothetical protein